MSEYFAGRVAGIRFSNEAQSFYVLEMDLDNGKTVTVRGTIPGLALKSGSWFGFEAHWESHPKYGMQLAVDKAPVIRGEWDADTALNMLKSHGVAIRVAQHIYEELGEEMVEALSDRERLEELPAIDEFTALHVVSRWKAIRSMFQSLEFLSDLGLPKQKLDQVYAHFGDETENVLSTDPWALVQVDGISFDQADEVAMRLGLKRDVTERIRGIALHTCKSRRGMGHLYLSSGDLVKGMKQVIPSLKPETIAQTLKTLHDEDLLVLDNQTKPKTTAIYEPWFYEIEKESARLLAERAETAAFDDEYIEQYEQSLATVGPDTEAMQQSGAPLEDIVEAAIREYSGIGNIHLSADQMQGAVNAMLEPVSILTGLPGTGKTTTLKLVVKVLEDIGIPFLLVAPTGIAAKRMSSVTGAEASTIHRAFGAKGIRGEERESTYAGIVGSSDDSNLEADGSSEYWSYSHKQTHPADVVIVDESSMVDQHLLFRLLTCTKPTCRVVFVGDAAQLPSVGPGNVLRDMISSEMFHTVNLKEIFRQDEASDIVKAAHAIHAGKVPDFPGSKDFVFISAKDESQIVETMTSMVSKLYNKRANFQVLSPRHGGTLGVTNLNLRIRDLLNPKQPGLREIRLGSETVREGDRIMVSKNNYRYEIFNGDVGKVVRLDQKAKEVEIKIHGPPTMHVRLPLKDAPSHLRMAYAITVHKSQGQEYDVILMPWVKSFRHQLQRNLIYTAITRARKKVILVGHSEAMSKAVTNNKVDTRNTLFPNRLEALLGSSTT
jgi:exodeoxyribonuclease V alpha subunit